MKKFAVVLSGCGNRDGSELQESLSLLLAIDRRGAAVQCFAPEGFFVAERYTDPADEDEGLEEGSLADAEQRDIFEESARVCRGAILPLSDYSPSDYDALLFPGGLGAAKNLSTYAFDGPNMVVVDAVQDAILATYRAHRPIGAMCIAPMLLAKTLGRYGVELTLGGDNPAATIAAALGCRVRVCGPTDVCVDAEHRVVTTPAYMVDTSIAKVFDGGDALVNAVFGLLPE